MMQTLKNMTNPYDSPPFKNNKKQLLLYFLWWCCVCDVKGDPVAECLFGIGAFQSILQNPMLYPFEPLHYLILIFYFHYGSTIPPMVVLSVLFDVQLYNQEQYWTVPWPHTVKCITNMIMKTWAKLLGI